MRFVLDLARRLYYAVGPRHLSEERLIKRAFFSGREPPGVMIDVGAHFGGALMPFALGGWRVHAFEPDPANRAKLLRRAGHLQNVSIDSRAVAEADGAALTLYTSSVSSGISTLSPFHPSHTTQIAVTTVRLETYCREQGISHIDFLKIDVEGFDLFVLRSFNWAVMRPKIVMCEFEDRKTKLLGYQGVEVADFLLNHGYRVLVSEWRPIVEYGMRHTWNRAYEFGKHPIRADVWGNFIGVSPELSLQALAREFTRYSRE